MLTTYPERPDLTVIVLTLNEAAHIERCLITARQVSRQLLVLDSGSEDATMAIARRFGARTHVRAFEGYANQRNAALELVDTEWVLFLDADEWITGQLAGEIHDALTSVTASINGFWTPRENRFGNRPLRGGGWWPDRQLRLFRRTAGRFDPAFQVHERVILDGGTGLFDNPLIHDNFIDLAEFRATQRRYLPMRVEQQIASGDPGKRRSVVGRPAREFWRRFVTLRGYRDGWLGAVLALMMAWYEFRMWRQIRGRGGATVQEGEALISSISSDDSSLDLSIVIVSYNTRELLAQCLASIEGWMDTTRRDAEVIVVDNASTDGSVDMTRRRFPFVRIMANDRNQGYSAANNQGMRQARGRYLVLLNPDTTVIGDSFGTLADYLDRHPNVGGAGPELRYPDGSVQPSRRRFPTRLTAFLESTLLQEWWPENRILRRYYLADRPADHAQEVDWLVGACLMIRRETLSEIGLFDEQFFMYAEEVDFCYRARQLGWRIMFLPSAVVTHHEAASSSQNIPARQINFDSSKVRLHRKLHGPLTAGLLHLFLLLTYVLKIAIETGKGMIGHKRQLRWERVRMYWHVLIARLRGTGGS